ncbi:restriction endonuclease subunit S [Vibrio tubiashii]|uniref:Restriction endonuclease subunit S n=1 Tax=Vibrio tubiashii ATCC 19109 TaxID=1051646 RepID=F9T152_9VIBR|nr:restriction endonuclease subunit S [Vibrio tubiashii]AIW16486.1 restriction endonuclease subunit S [Vibrio tubiashii ATCC 19109]EGU58510.1 type I restriction-modification system specificity subunit [Vibrio tubiashii ATCC 19109]EIF04865.1 type I restriction-modification system specificity subunit [Vibrio tubiashii NCIMB 1337 = ATCC 19106]
MTGRYKAYPEYKSVDANTIIPLDWNYCQAKRYLTVQSGDMLPATRVRDSGTPVVGGNGYRGFTDSANTKANTIVIGRVGAKCGCVHTIKEDFWASEHAFKVISRKQYNMSFMAYLLESLNLNQYAITTAQPLLNTEIVTSKYISLPNDLMEQQKIANFLDHETAKIYTLITKQEKLIELLKEKRQAVISHAVTKGLNPQAPMRDSGVEWLGEVPEHWTISPSKRLFPESKNRAPTSDMQLSATQDYGVISQKKFMQLAGRKVVQLNSNQELRKKVHVGDFVISMRSFQGGLERAWDEGGIRSSYVVLKPSETVNKDYFQYLFKSVRYIQAIQSTANFIRDGQDMNYQNFVSIDLPLPSLEEQEYIASYLRAHINKIDSLVEKAQKAISLMQERKIALISAAVTGKIDVRDWVASGEVSNG